MNKNLIFGIIAVITLFFAACSDDKDNDGIAGKIAGTYVGTLQVTQEDGTPMGDPMENQKIFISRVGDNAVDLELIGFSFQGLAVGDLKIPGAQVTESGNITGSASQVSIMGGVIKADLTLSGTVRDNKADLVILVNAPLAPGEDPMVMRVTFKGSK